MVLEISGIESLSFVKQYNKHFWKKQVWKPKFKNGFQLIVFIQIGF